MISLVVLLALVALLLFPVPSEFDLIWSPSPLVDDDVSYTFWLCWYLREHVKELVRSPRQALVTDLLFYPAGFDIYLETPNFLGAIVSIPFVLVLGFPQGLNVTAVIFMFSNAAAAWWLLRTLGISPWPSLTGALMYTLNPFVVDQMVYYRYEHLILFFLPLFLGWFIRAMRGGKMHCIMAVAMYWFICLNDWFHGIFMAILGLAIAVREFLDSKVKGDRKSVATRLLCFCTLYCSLAVPFLYPFFSRLAGGERVFGLSVESGLRLSSTIQEAAGSGQLIQAVGPLGFIELLPPLYLVLMLTFVAVALRRWRVTGFWVIVGCLFYLLALGRNISLGPNGPTIPLPFLLLEWLIPPLSRLTQMGRFLPFCVVSWSIAAGFGQHYLMEKTERQWLRAALFLVPLVLLLAVSSGWTTLARNRVPAAPSYLSSLTDSPRGAVIDLPWGTGTMSGRAVFLQTFHGRPIMGGSGVQLAVGVPAELRDLFEKHAILQYLVQLGQEDENGQKKSSAGPPVDGVPVLYRLGFRHVVLHRVTFKKDVPFSLGEKENELSGPAPLSLQERKRFLEVKRTMEQLFGEPVYQDTEAVVFRVEKSTAGAAGTQH